MYDAIVVVDACVLTEFDSPVDTMMNLFLRAYNSKATDGVLVNTQENKIN